MARFSTATHWGAYGVETQDGEVVSMEPFPEDPDPSPIASSNDFEKLWQAYME